MSWEEGNVSKFSLAVAESTALKGSGRGSMWGRREETQWPLKGALDIYWSEFLPTLGQNSCPNVSSHCLHTPREGELTLCFL